MATGNVENSRSQHDLTISVEVGRVKDLFLLLPSLHTTVENGLLQTIYFF